MKNNIKYMSLSVMLTISALAVLTLGSCNDFLSIEPQNEIVLENYWTEEADVNSVLNSCYAQLESPDCVKRMAVWGELRSANMTNGSGTPYVIQQVLTGMANMNTGLGMVILGATLGASNIGLMITDTRLYKAIALRLVVVPLVCIPILMFMPVPFEVRMVMMIIAAAPAASATSMLALKYGADYSYGTGLSIGTTIVSMITMPLVLALAMAIL